MNDEFKLQISDSSEIDALELQNRIDEHTQSLKPVELSTEPLPNGHTSGDPGLAALLLTYAPQVIPPLVAALAAWIAAGRKRNSSSARRLIITRNGIVYSDVKIDDLEIESSGKSLENVLTKMLGGADNTTGKPTAA